MIVHMFLTPGFFPPRCIRYLNRNAYVATALHGTDFCSSAQTAFLLLYKNMVRIEVLSKVTTFIIFVSKLVIVGIAVALAYLLLA